MLNAVSSLKGLEIQARDGSLGTVSDFLFDDSTWKVRWMVVGTGGWLTGRKVLIAPSAVISAKSGATALHVALTKTQVEDSPDIGQDRPVSRQVQNDLYGYYGWDPLWDGGMYAGGMYGGSTFGGEMGTVASPLRAPAYPGTAAVQEAERNGTGVDENDPHLRSIAEVTGYHVQATDGDIGHVQDFLLDNVNWGVRYLVVDTSNWWVGQHVLISPYAVEGVDWPERHIRLDLTRDKIKSSPSWNPSNVVDGHFERQLHNYYGWPDQANVQPAGEGSCKQHTPTYLP